MEEVVGSREAEPHTQEDSVEEEENKELVVGVAHTVVHPAGGGREGGREGWREKGEGKGEEGKRMRGRKGGSTESKKGACSDRKMICGHVHMYRRTHTTAYYAHVVCI